MKVGIILKSPDPIGKVSEDTVIFVDAGFKFKDQLKDKKVLAVVGDFDSLGSAPNGENIVTLNAEKNFTDGEYAIRYAVENGATEVVIYGAFGGKIEHILGNIALLKIAKDLSIEAHVKSGDRLMKLLDKSATLTAKKGSNLSLIPYGGNCSFNKSFGLYYPLDGLTLTPSDTRGISNVVVDQTVKIDILSGLVLAIYEE